jgi:hypothetical protein
MAYFRSAIIAFGLFSKLYGAAEPLPSPGPWLTGPLIAPPGTVIAKGTIEIEAFLFVTTNTGVYDDKWHAHSTPNFVSTNPQIFTLVGLTEWMDIHFIPQVVYNWTKGASSVHFGDLPIGLDFQAYPANADGYFPGVKISLVETFPTGKFQKLNPHKKGTEVSGTGSFASSLGVVFYKVYHLWDRHFLSTTLNFAYTVFAPVRVKGLNVYGGGPHTHGTVHPGNVFQAIWSFEFTLDQNWVFAIDNVYLHGNKNRFSGHKGTVDGETATVGGPSSEQISFAPAIEYNFSSNFGIIAGAWVTAWGRNSTQFRSFVVNLDYTF